MPSDCSPLDKQDVLEFQEDPVVIAKDNVAIAGQREVFFLTFSPIVQKGLNPPNLLQSQTIGGRREWKSKTNLSRAQNTEQGSGPGRSSSCSAALLQETRLRL